MRRGCISLGEIQCTKCNRIVPYAERYLAIDEENGTGTKTGESAHYCVECAVQKGYATYTKGNSEQTLSFFP